MILIRLLIVQALMTFKNSCCGNALTIGMQAGVKTESHFRNGNLTRIINATAKRGPESERPVENTMQNNTFTDSKVSFKSKFAYDDVVCTDTCQTKRFCRCDRLCLLFSDCCEDFNAEQEPGGMTKKVIRIRDLKNSFKCVQPSPHSENISVVATCPDMFENEQQRRMCENVLDANLVEIIPIFDKDLLISYRNIYCAECNSANSTVPWKVFAGFVDRNLVDGSKGLHEIGRGILKSHASVLVFDANGFDHRGHACGKLTDTCKNQEPTATNDSALCSSYSNIVRGVNLDGESIYFKNPECAACNGFMGSLECLEHNGLSDSRITFNRRLNVDELFARRREVTNNLCDENMMFDKAEDVCRHVVCLKGRVPFYGKCVVPLLNTSGRSFIPHVVFSAFPAISDQQWPILISSWLDGNTGCDVDSVVLNEISVTRFGRAVLTFAAGTFYETYVNCTAPSDEGTRPLAGIENRACNVFISNLWAKLNGTQDFAVIGVTSAMIIQSLDIKVEKQIIHPNQTSMSTSALEVLSRKCPCLKFSLTEATDFAHQYLKRVLLNKRNLHFIKTTSGIQANTIDGIREEFFVYYNDSFYTDFDGYVRINSVFRDTRERNKAPRGVNHHTLFFVIVFLPVVLVLMN